VYSYLTSQLVGERRRELQAEQRRAQATSSRRAWLTRRRGVRLAVRKVQWLRSEPQR